MGDTTQPDKILRSMFVRELPEKGLTGTQHELRRGVRRDIHGLSQFGVRQLEFEPQAERGLKPLGEMPDGFGIRRVGKDRLFMTFNNPGGHDGIPLRLLNLSVPSADTIVFEHIESPASHGTEEQGPKRTLRVQGMAMRPQV